jgi:hypothetical protein
MGALGSMTTPVSTCGCLYRDGHRFESPPLHQEVHASESGFRPPGAIPLAEELLEAPKELILTALEVEQSGGVVIADKVGDTTCMFLAKLYRAEEARAGRLGVFVIPYSASDERILT